MKGPRRKLGREQPTARHGAASGADRRAKSRNDRRARARGKGRQQAAQPQHGGVPPQVRTLKRFSAPEWTILGVAGIGPRSMAASLWEGPPLAPHPSSQGGVPLDELAGRTSYRQMVLAQVRASGLENGCAFSCRRAETRRPPVFETQSGTREAGGLTTSDSSRPCFCAGVPLRRAGAASAKAPSG